MNTTDERRDRFRDLHLNGLFLIPNPFDVGSARLLEHLGFQALATTSSGFAATLGRNDQYTTRSQLVEHVRSICAAVTLPVNVDAEACFPLESGGIDETVELFANVGAAGVSIEDFDPTTNAILPIDQASERVALAVGAARRHGVVITARAESLLYGSTDTDDVIARLRAYRKAGADVLYAPGVKSTQEIRRIVDIGLPVNVLALPGVPNTTELRSLGVRRVSTGGALAWSAYGALLRAATQLRDDGTYDYFDSVLDRSTRETAFSDR
jgi:2-methylisocitrate lyase-like PEP mutase family enzyme